MQKDENPIVNTKIELIHKSNFLDATIMVFCAKDEDAFGFEVQQDKANSSFKVRIKGE